MSEFKLFTKKSKGKAKGKDKGKSKSAPAYGGKPGPMQEVLASHIKAKKAAKSKGKK